MVYSLRLTLEVFDDDVKDLKEVLNVSGNKRFIGEIFNYPTDHFEEIGVSLDSVLTQAELRPLDFETIYGEEVD